ncbi:hypothetical protein ACLOJK_033616 [Asimina triloba]
MDTEKKSVLGGVLDGSDPNDPFDFLKILPNPDGSLTRFLPVPDLPPYTQPPPFLQTNDHVLSKDVLLNPSNHTWLRIYRPYLLSTPTTSPLPIIIFFHGGGFILLSAASAHFHRFCDRLALYLPAIVLSVNYRLAPEHRLPAAYDDAMDALRWVKNQEELPTALRDPWMAPDIADSSCCFLMGSSSGGNIAYYLWQQEQLPLKIVGVILDQPFFGGVERTESELRMADSLVVPLPVSDLMWELALPEGADRDHEFSNPETLEKKKKMMMIEGNSTTSSSSKVACLLRACARDPQVDRQRAWMKKVGEKGVKVVAHFADDGYHGIQFFEEDKREIMLMEVKHFVSSVFRTSTTNT